MFLNTFGERLKYAREKKEITQDELSKKLGLDKNVQLSRWENGVRTPRLITAQKLSEVLNVRLEWLLHGTGDMEAGGKDPFEGAENPKSFVSLRVIHSAIIKHFLLFLENYAKKLIFCLTTYPFITIM